MPVVLTEKHSPHITIVTLNRPERRNALSIQLLTELIAAIKLASDQPHERIIVLRGSGAAFCTGLDLKEAQNQTKAHATADLVAHVLGALSEAHPVTGTHELPGLPMRFSDVERCYRSPAPTLGQHTEEVLRELLGLGDDAIAELRAEGIAGERPAGV